MTLGISEVSSGEREGKENSKGEMRKDKETDVERVTQEKYIFGVVHSTAYYSMVWSANVNVLDQAASYFLTRFTSHILCAQIYT